MWIFDRFVSIKRLIRGIFVNNFHQKDKKNLDIEGGALV